MLAEWLKAKGCDSKDAEMQVRDLGFPRRRYPYIVSTYIGINVHTGDIVLIYTVSCAGVSDFGFGVSWAPSLWWRSKTAR